MAGGFQQNASWHYYFKLHTRLENWFQPDNVAITYYYDPNGKLTLKPYNYYFTYAWAEAPSQYAYFSNEENGYINGEVITIESYTDIANAVANYNIQKGDLLYWYEIEDGEEVVKHATMISSVTNDDILYTGHSNPRFDTPASEVLKGNGQSLKVIRLKDYF